MGDVSDDDDDEGIYSRHLGLNVFATAPILMDAFVSLTVDGRARASSLTVDDIRQAVVSMRKDYGRRPSTLIVPAWMLEWPRRLMFTGYPDVLNRTRPWPRIVLFPRLTRLGLRATMWRRRPLMQLEKLALRCRRYGLAERIRDVDFWLKHRG